MSQKHSKLDDVWVDWLRDEPLPPRAHADAVEAGDVRVHKPMNGHADNPGAMHIATPSTESQGSASVSIQIQMPTLTRPTWMRIPRYTKAQVRYWSSFAMVVVAVALGARFGVEVASDKFFDGPHTGPVAGSNTGSESTTPTFSPVVPGDKKKLAEQGDSAGKYDPSKKLYSYNDTNLGANLTISQQPLPQSFKDNPSEIKKAAESIKAEHKIATAWGDAYLFTDDIEKGGTQRVVFAHRDMLVFVQSNKKLGDDAWKFYIENLR